MTTASQEMGSVTPHLVCAGAADAIDFYTRAFGADEMFRLPGRDGRLMHAELSINGMVVMLADEIGAHGMLGPKALKGTPVSLHLMVDDVDAWVARAAEAGARVTMPAAEMFWGDRFAMIEDPFGHVWSIATHVRDVSEAEMREAALTAACG